MKELLLLSGLGVLSLIAEILSIRKLIYPLVIIGLLVNIGFCVNDFGNNENIYGMMMLDRTPLVFTILFSFIAILWFTMANHYFEDETNLSDHFSLVLFSMVGVFILTSYTHMVMLFLGVEILSIPVYVLAGSDKRNIFSNEAAFKYFLLGSFASGFLLLGIAFIYGALGSFNIIQIASMSMSPYGVSQQLLIIGTVLIIFALAFKMSAAPFHFWAPDVYDGSPSVFSSFMMTIVKAAGFIALINLFYIKADSLAQLWKILLFIVIIVTLVVGNITAIFQQSVKRMMAYSSIAQAGFMLFALYAINDVSKEGILLYAVAYTLATVGIFAILVKIEDYTLEGYNGLAKTQPMLAFVNAIFVFSLAGIPLTAGFFAKYYMLAAVIKTGGNAGIVLVIIGVIFAAVSVYYYFKILQAMYFNEGDAKVNNVSAGFKYGLFLLALTIIFIGIFPDTLINWFYF